MTILKAWRAELLWTRAAPGAAEGAAAHHPDGLLLAADGRIAAAGPFEALSPGLPEGLAIEDLRGRMIVPGLVDAHVHFPQIGMIGAPGGELMDWLERYTFPAERAFADPGHARRMAQVFLDALLAAGTTTAMVYGSVHRGSVEALFEAALARDMRLIAGKCLMDRGPPGLRDTALDGEADTRALIDRWHGRGRLGYAVTPRFALGSSPEQLAGAGRILAAHPGVWMQTHLAENLREIEATARAFPEARDYLDVYDRAGLLGRRSVFGHCVHMEDRALDRMAQAGCACAFCPGSNLFLGSGLFDLERARTRGVRVALGSDIGAGVSLSMLANGAEAYKVGQLRGQALSPLAAFDLATRAAAEALDLAGVIGTLDPGAEADFVVLDPAASPLLAERWAASRDVEDRLMALMVLGQEQAVARTYVAGNLAHARVSK